MKIIRLFLLSIFAVASLSAYSGSGDKSSNPLQSVRRSESPKSNGRPSAPSNARIYFCYDSENGECVFTLRDDIEYMSVSLESLSTGQMYYGDVDASDPTMSVELPASNYYIMCVTDNGSVYEGEVVVP